MLGFVITAMTRCSRARTGGYINLESLYYALTHMGQLTLLESITNASYWARDVAAGGEHTPLVTCLKPRRGTYGFLEGEDT